jgi:hypothetical protein
MSKETTTFPPVLLDAPVRHVAAQQNVAEYLPALIELTQRIYSMARSFQLGIESDPEIENDWHIVFHLALTVDVETSLQLDREWIDGLCSICPAPLTSIFRLRVDLIDS